MKRMFAFLSGVVVLLVAGAASAHSLRVECKKMTATEIVCRSIFTDGEVSPNTTIQVFDDNDNVLATGKTDARGQYAFKSPAVEYHVVVQASKRHVGSVSSVDFW